MPAEPSLLPSEYPALLAALAVGMIVGLERGWRERERPDGGRVAGLRTFALTGLLGGVMQIAGPWMVAAAALGLAVLGSVSYREGVRTSGSLSATTAIAWLLTYGLGALAAGGHPVLALGTSVLVAVLLDARSTLHRWLRLLEHQELTAALQMLVLSAVVLPLLPDAGYGPFGALNPYRLWWAVVLIAGLSLSGHFAIRLSGEQRGTLWTGMLGGLASSTAATVALSRQLRGRPSLVESTAAGALAACAVMYARIALVVGLMAPTLLPLVAPACATGAAVMAAFALWHWRRQPGAAEAADSEPMRPFDLGTALGFGAFLGITAVLSQACRQWLGEPGLIGLGAVSGLVDVDAISISISRLASAGSVARPLAAWVVATAVASNMVMKAAVARIIGGAGLGRRIAWAYSASMAAAGLALVLALRGA